MASEKEIKNRIKSINDTQKITNAMYLISSMKLKKARVLLENAQPYIDEIHPAISMILRSVPDINNVFFDDYKPPVKRNEDGSIKEKDPHRKKVRAYLVITADKGLAGAYNHNVIKLAEQKLKEAEDGDEYDHRFYVVGELGRQYFKSKGIRVSHHFMYTAQDPKISRAFAIAQHILPKYESGEIDEIYMIYTVMVNSMREDATVEKIFPLHRKEYEPLSAEEAREEQPVFQIWPSADAVISQSRAQDIRDIPFAGLVDRVFDDDAVSCELSDCLVPDLHELIEIVCRLKIKGG